METAPLVGAGLTAAPAEDGATPEGEVAPAVSKSFEFAGILLAWSEVLEFRAVTLEAFMEERGF